MYLCILQALNPASQLAAMNTDKFVELRIPKGGGIPLGPRGAQQLCIGQRRSGTGRTN